MPRFFKNGFTQHHFLHNHLSRTTKFKSGAGFTMIEVSVTLAILGLVLVAVYGVYSLSQKAYSTEENAIEITQNGRVILERLTREIRQASEMVTELPEAEEMATSTIMFEDGHIEEPYQYIRYFKTDGLVKREVVGFYFSGDFEENLVPWDATPPAGQTMETKFLQEAQTIGEYVIGLKFWGSKTIYIALDLNKKQNNLQLKTSVFGRNF